ncbi:hypothetical protein [Zavarzinia aquatilis]|uniref:Uncharacterized protein n=1 Tax=Zavarzinia aquatilis TaxID=2211142 RepID=A0A317EHA1_9PROT|nr:hypothetical protein [Zavarzinia aquatilis]PWR24585.1 hypothetical protein DKG74_07205 [Zavarzinia aquatilis]
MATKTFSDLTVGAPTPVGDEVFPIWQDGASKKLTRAQLLDLLDLVIGSDIQGFDADLSAIAALGDGLPRRAAAAWSALPYEEGTWTPSPTFTTAGDLAITSNTLAGKYQRLGNRVKATLDGNFTPTWTTASGSFVINGLPFVTGSVIGGGHIQSINARFVGYTGTPVARVSPSNSFILLQTNIAGASTATMTVANLSSGFAHTINLAVEYWI